MQTINVPKTGWITLFDHLTPDIFSDPVSCIYNSTTDISSACWCCAHPEDSWDCDGLKGRITECCHGLLTEYQLDYFYNHD